MEANIDQKEFIRPKELYHASENRNILMFEPRQESYRDWSEGKVVFATPEKGYAAMFMVPVSDNWTRRGFYNRVPYMIIRGTKENFEEIDEGGAIYTLSSKSFQTDLSKEIGANEWVSKHKVQPLDKEEYDSALEAMLENGVQVFFVDKEVFEKIDKSSDSGRSIVVNLESENKRLNKNVTEISP